MYSTIILVQSYLGKYTTIKLFRQEKKHHLLWRVTYSALQSVPTMYRELTTIKCQTFENLKRYMLIKVIIITGTFSDLARLSTLFENSEVCLKNKNHH